MSSMKLYCVYAILIIFSCHIQANIVTPSGENKLLANVSDEEVREYDVFGYPSVKNPQKRLTYEERLNSIEEYILKRIFEQEGNIPSVLKSEDYKRNYNKLLKKNAVDILKQKLINEKFISKETVIDYCEQKGIDFNDKVSPEQKEEIIKAIKNDKKEEIKEFVTDHLDNLKEQYEIYYNNDLFSNISDLKYKEKQQYLDHLEKIRDQVLVSYEDIVSKVSSLIDQIEKIEPYFIDNLSNEKVLKAMVEGKILNSVLISEAEKAGLLNDIHVVNKTKDQMKYFVGKKYSDIIFADSNFIPEKSEMIDYYIAHKDDEILMSKRKMWVIEIFKEYNNNDDNDNNDKIKVAIELENIRQKILKGESFEKYAEFYPRPHTKKGILGYIHGSDYAKIGKTAVKMKENEISDLIIQEKAISIIKVTEVFEPKLYKFEYVEDIIKHILMDKKKRSYKEELKKELFEKYDVVILEKKNTDKE